MHEGKFCVKINRGSAADGLLRFLGFHLQGTGSGEKRGRILGSMPEGKGVARRVKHAPRTPRYWDSFWSLLSYPESADWN